MQSSRPPVGFFVFGRAESRFLPPAPHADQDTVVLVGSVGVLQSPTQPTWLFPGCTTASVQRFTALGCSRPESRLLLNQ